MPSPCKKRSRDRFLGAAPICARGIASGSVSSCGGLCGVGRMSGRLGNKGASVFNFSRALDLLHCMWFYAIHGRSIARMGDVRT